ncbi:hypothetical protein ABT160_28510 [Streptomyces sp. NPDC001941]|uniref:hypothetical protein n=1 Tax=Streptomyces sp. NPDC001941 TaxID=3154659 RepID=UPI00332F8949
MTLAPPLDTAEHLRLLHRLGLDAATPEHDAHAAELRHKACQIDPASAHRLTALINIFLPDGRQHFIGMSQPEDTQEPLERTMQPGWGFCSTFLTRQLALVLADVRDMPRSASNPVVARLGILTYSGAPLIYRPDHTGHGLVLGAVCYVGPAPMDATTRQESLTVIKAFRDQVMTRAYTHAARATP